MVKETLLESIAGKYRAIGPLLDEKSRRVWAATEARVIGRGGPMIVAAATGLSRTTIYQGMKSAQEVPPESVLSRIRSRGGGRKKLTLRDPVLVDKLDALVDPTSRGDPESPLRWTIKSTRQLAAALSHQGHPIGRQKVSDLLADLHYSLQANRKTKEGASHPDRNAQFEYIIARVKDFQGRGQPVISVDAKKKEKVGDFANGGREWRRHGEPERVRVHDFEDKRLGKVAPYGVYDLTKNQGWVSVGVDHDTAEFAVETIRRWWEKMGRPLYPRAAELLITADGGGSNGSRLRLWKVVLQRLADETGLRLEVCHFPPGTSKWNKIEHRMFSHITANWRGKPLTSHEVIVNLIANTTTRKGLKITAELDQKRYPAGIKISRKQLQEVNLRPAEFHGEWNYSILPH
jgi:hypothetical protein